MATAHYFFDEIHRFLHFAEKLDLSAEEELVLLAIPAKDWSRWRSCGVAPGTMVPPLLQRRMTYALQILERMAANQAHVAPSRDARAS